MWQDGASVLGLCQEARGLCRSWLALLYGLCFLDFAIFMFVISFSLVVVQDFIYPQKSVHAICLQHSGLNYDAQHRDPTIAHACLDQIFAIRDAILRGIRLNVCHVPLIEFVRGLRFQACAEGRRRTKTACSGPRLTMQPSCWESLGSPARRTMEPRYAQV